MAEIGYGASLFMDNDEIENVKSITPPAPEIGEVETTHLQSTGRWKTYIAGMKEPGELSFEAEYTETLFATLFAALSDEKTWTIEFNETDDVVQVDGFLKKVEPTIGANEDEKMVKGTVKLTGPVTIESPSSTYP